MKWTTSLKFTSLNEPKVKTLKELQWVQSLVSAASHRKSGGFILTCKLSDSRTPLIRTRKVEVFLGERFPDLLERSEGKRSSGSSLMFSGSESQRDERVTTCLWKGMCVCVCNLSADWLWSWTRPLNKVNSSEPQTLQTISLYYCRTSCFVWFYWIVCLFVSLLPFIPFPTL